MGNSALETNNEVLTELRRIFGDEGVAVENGTYWFSASAFEKLGRTSIDDIKNAFGMLMTGHFAVTPDEGKFIADPTGEAAFGIPVEYLNTETARKNLPNTQLHHFCTDLHAATALGQTSPDYSANDTLNDEAGKTLVLPHSAMHKYAKQQTALEELQSIYPSVAVEEREINGRKMYFIPRQAFPANFSHQLKQQDDTSYTVLVPGEAGHYAMALRSQLGSKQHPPVVQVIRAPEADNYEGIAIDKETIDRQFHKQQLDAISTASLQWHIVARTLETKHREYVDLRNMEAHNNSDQIKYSSRENFRNSDPEKRNVRAWMKETRNHLKRLTETRDKDDDLGRKR